MTGTPLTVGLTLSSDRALVLFEFLSRLIRDENGVALLPLVRHDAELWALNSVVAALESELAEPFQDNYLSLVEEARIRIAANAGPWPRDSASEV